MLTILFVCTGNTCRSPIAAALCREMLAREKKLAGVKVASAGLAADVGEKVSDNARIILKEERIDLSGHRAVSLNKEKVEGADLILVMTPQHKRELFKRYPGAEGKTHLLKEYSGVTAGDPAIADPYLGNLEEYRITVEEIRTGLKKLIWKLKGGSEDESSTGQ